MDSEPIQAIRRRHNQRFIFGIRSFKGKITKNNDQSTRDEVMRNWIGKMTFAQSSRRQIGKDKKRKTPAKRYLSRFIPLFSPACGETAKYS